jgi:hypothetical protein
MVIDFEMRTDTDGLSALLAVVVEITNPEAASLDYEYKSIYDMTNDVVVFEHELTIEELEMVDEYIMNYLEGMK